MTDLILYSREDCHLCDEAAAMLRVVAPQQSFKVVEIDDDIQLLDRYGVRVPVLRREPSGDELGWPFDAATLNEFIKAS